MENGAVCAQVMYVHLLVVIVYIVHLLNRVSV